MWSLGITCIELATGYPPYHTESPMTAVRYILSCDPPTLSPDKFGRPIRDFIGRVLIKEPSLRAGASELAKSHPFVNKATSKRFQGLISEWNRERRRKGKLKVSKPISKETPKRD